jgi:hypothetical protein
LAWGEAAGGVGKRRAGLPEAPHRVGV